MTPRHSLVALLLLPALAATACGSSESSDSDSAAKPTIRNGAPDPWTEQQIIDALNLRTEPDEVDANGDPVPDRPAQPGDLGPSTPSGCGVSVILTSAKAIEVYAGAGDTVVTNPGGTAGVKTGNDQACLAELERGLAKLKRP